MDFIMEDFDENLLNDEFQFCLEMIILTRNANGATLWEIRDDFLEHFDIDLESIWGYNCWHTHVRQLLTNVMLNIKTVTKPAGYVLYYMDINAAIHEFEKTLSENMLLICKELNITLKGLREMERVDDPKSPRSTKASQPHIVSSKCEFYRHSLIGDHFFLELAHNELKYLKTPKSIVGKIGQCISGQSIHAALKHIPDVINELADNVIINLGSVDLVQGRELIDMIKDMRELCHFLWMKKIMPIVTTIPPLANQMHNDDLEKKRKAFNIFLMEHIDCIDIEPCFLSEYNRVLFDTYQGEPKSVSGTRHSFVLWNHIGRQMVVKKLKRKLPDIYQDYSKLINV